MSAFVRGEFLKDHIRFFESLPEVAEQAAMMSINQVTEREAVPMIRNAAEAQVNFPNGYLDSAERLGVSRLATRSSLEAVITARDRPTSLARFSTMPLRIGKAGVHVKVSRKGGGRTLKRAFPVRLPAGKGGTASNLGLAIRLPVGEEPSKAYKPILLTTDKYGSVWLLYGPSVEQVVRTVAEDSLPEIGEKLSREFFRQFTRLSRG